MSGYIGTTPTPQATQTRDVFTATASQTSFATSGYSVGFLDVYVNGSHLKNGTDYTATNGSDVVMASGLAAGDYVEVVAFTTFSTSDTVSASGGGTFSGDVTFADGADIVTASAGTSNFRAGVNAGNSIQSGGNYNVVVGDEAGTAITTGDNNTAVGFEALTTNNTGHSNVSVGYQSQYANTIGNHNVSIGLNALDANTAGDRNVAVGSRALTDFNVTSTADTYNTAVGYFAGARVTTGVQNTAIGGEALYSNTTASNNTAVGYQAAYANTTGTSNVALGYTALDANTTADNNTALGAYALTSNTTGANNTASGSGVMNSNTTGSDNTAMGVSALYYNNGSYNTAIGRQALISNTTASQNTAVGYQAGYSGTTGNNNVALGHRSGFSATTPNQNTFVGAWTGYSVTTGGGNTFVGTLGSSGGAGCGYYMTTGSDNTIIGGFTGNQGGLDIRTSSNNIVLSDGDGNPYLYKKGGDRWVITNPVNSTWGANLQHTGTTPYGFYIQYPNAAPNNSSSEFIYAADSSTSRFIVYANGNVVNQNNSYGAISDVKLKENIVDSESQWDDIKALTVRKYSMKSDNLDAPNRLGVIAQEVEAAGMGGLVFESPDRDSETNEDLGTVTKQVNYSILYMKAVKALQEAMTRIETLETEVAALKEG